MREPYPEEEFRTNKQKAEEDIYRWKMEFRRFLSFMPYDAQEALDECQEEVNKRLHRSRGVAA